MKRLILCFLPVVFISIVFQILTTSPASSEQENIDKTLILKLENPEDFKWKEISRKIDEEEGLREFIPTDQNIETWSQLICVQYITLWPEVSETEDPLGAVVDTIRKTTLAAYSGNRVSWNIIEKNKNDIVYEWILHEPFRNIPAQHEIVRAFRTKNRFYRIGVTRKYSEMNNEERENWIKFFKKSVSLVSHNEAGRIKGFIIPLL
jgi:hypothetical protein